MKELIEKILQDYFNNKSIKIKDLKQTLISHGSGFVASIYKIEIVWERKEAENGQELELPDVVAIKVPKLTGLSDIFEKLSCGTETATQEQDASTAALQAMTPIIHNGECTVYRILSQENPIPIPLIYGSKLIDDQSKEGVIVMEYLGSDRAAIVDSLAKGLSLSQWRSIVDHLADLHAWSLTTTVPWRQLIKGPDVLIDIFRAFLAAMEPTLKVAKGKYPEYFGNINIDLIIKEVTVEKFLEMLEEAKGIIPEVLQHGDMWMNNVMFEKEPDGTLGNKVAAFIDWQGSRERCGLLDLVRLSICINHEIRQANEIHVLKRYYDRLMATSGGKVRASFGQVEKIYTKIAAWYNLYAPAAADLTMEVFGDAQKDQTGWVKKEILTRIEATYEDGESYFLENNDNKLRL